MQVLNRHHLPDKRLPPGAVYIGRGTPFGNPFPITADCDRAQSIAQFREYLDRRIESLDPVQITGLLGLKEGAQLVCSCAPLPCHGDVLIEVARRMRQNGRPPTPRFRTYAGVGSRETPPAIQARMRRIAERLAARGYRLHSGSADGADLAFEAGAGEDKHIFLPFPGFNRSLSALTAPSHEAIEIAKLVHPVWHKLGHKAALLQGRNSHQVLGSTCREPVDFLVCWSPDGCESEAERTKATGGTGQAIALASRWGVPVFNLARADGLDRLAQHVLAAG